MKKILFAMTNLRGGGAEKVLVDILKNIDKRNMKVTLLLFNKIEVYLDEVPKDINIIYANEMIKFIPERFWIRLPNRIIKKIYRRIIKDKYDVEIAFLEGMPTKFIAASNNKDSKKIAWIHTDLLQKHWTSKLFLGNEEQKCYDNFDDIVFVSRDSRDSFKKLFKENTNNKVVMYNPIIEEDIISKSNEGNIRFDDFTIISVGRLDKQKGFDRLIEVHSKLVKKYPHKLVIVGEGDERANLEELIKDLGVENSVELKGFIKNPHPYVKAADLFVCASRNEGYSLVVAEALILEKLIISTRITGPKEVLNNGEYGIITNNDEHGLYSAIENVLKDKSIIERYKNNIKKGKNSLNYKERIKSIEELINNC